MSQRSNELARQLEQAVAEFGEAVEACSDAQWAAMSMMARLVGPA
jgi:hypothetical protein